MKLSCETLEDVFFHLFMKTMMLCNEKKNEKPNDVSSPRK